METGQCEQRSSNSQLRVRMDDRSSCRGDSGKRCSFAHFPVRDIFAVLPANTRPTNSFFLLLVTRCASCVRLLRLNRTPAGEQVQTDLSIPMPRKHRPNPPIEMLECCQGAKVTADIQADRRTVAVCPSSIRTSPHPIEMKHAGKGHLSCSTGETSLILASALSPQPSARNARLNVRFAPSPSPWSSLFSSEGSPSFSSLKPFRIGDE